MEIDTADGFVMEATVVFGWVVSEIIEPWLPVNIEHTLADSVAQPVESHIHCFRSFLFDCFVDDTGCCAVVSFQRGSWLRMSHFNQALSEGDGFSSVQE